ncbi:hypothetical protein FIBSPDRAFT_962446 [Athelia psychrophila]|uniref:Uncharacterized protein n=1 Tax=Athelia psychrophila TaxID=1759441 RepID=A0A166A472_9AGAM|nr:hypothetical protein FIBSPDRAFT_962446 [Fibularhizoctonia sp. CBS 109695]
MAMDELGCVHRHGSHNTARYPGNTVAHDPSFFFSVKVTGAIVGGVQTNIDMHSATSIPAGALYRPMENIYQAKAAATSNTGHPFIFLITDSGSSYESRRLEVMTDRCAFAKTVVDEALASPRAWLYAGYVAWAICTFGGQRIFVSILFSCAAATQELTWYAGRHNVEQVWD